VIIDDLDIVGAVIAPGETNPPLIIDADRVLPSPVALERFESVAWRRAQVIKYSGAIQQKKFASRLALDGAIARDVLISEKARGCRVLERADQQAILLRGIAQVEWPDGRLARTLPLNPRLSLRAGRGRRVTQRDAQERIPFQ
jgi:hypothetical protein